MNRNIERLYRISQQDSRLIVGLMSGTSLDGLDIALCHITGSGHNTQLKLLQFSSKTYSSEFRNLVRSVFAQRHIDQQTLSGLNAYIGQLHAQLVLETLREWHILPTAIDLIASHGQTVFHAPQRLTGDLKLPNSTLQIGDGDHIAVRTGIITLSDFRQKHIAGAGEGAPLAAYGDFLLYRSPLEHRILLNIGGISNFTFLPRQNSDMVAFATDIGPGNTLMNQYIKTSTGLEMDEDGKMAAAGLVHNELLAALCDEDFLRQEFPKTTGPELFNLSYLDQKIANLADPPQTKEDIMATLNAFSARTIAEAIEKVAYGLENVVVYTSGGGVHNPALMESIKRQVTQAMFGDIKTLGMHADAKEACLFAVLANETVAGSPQNVEAIEESPAICMGKISLPN